MAPRLTAAQKWMVDLAAKNIVDQQRGGNASYGIVAQAVKNMQANRIGISPEKLRDALAYRIKVLKAESELRRNDAEVPGVVTAEVPGVVLVEETDRTEVSAVTHPTAGSPGDSQGSSVVNSSSSSSKPGRPVGTTNKAKYERDKLLIIARNKIAVKYSNVLSECKKHNIRAPRGCLDSIIHETKQEMRLPEDVKINKLTLKNRMRNSAKSLTPAHRGTVSPVSAIEPIVVATIIQMGKMNTPMDKASVLSFINDLIDGTEYQESLLKMKKKLKIPQGEEELNKLGKGYYEGFLERHGHLLQSKKCKRFALNRSEWMRPEYIEQMYDNIYEIFVEARVARKLQSPVAYDVSGNVVPMGSKDQYGFESNIFIPQENLDLIFFCDETGINTCQKNDGHDGGKRFLVERFTEALLPANTSDHRATVLPLLSARGDLILLVVIFMSDSSEVNALWASGIDVMVDPVPSTEGCPATLNPDNHGPGKFCPGALNCMYKGKTIQTQFYTSPKGSITAEILVKIFKYLDSLELFNRSAGAPEPCLVVDGHDSRLHPSFLKYINDPAHKWNVAVGVPYLTHLWQVGDASECNGSFKMQWYRAKQQLMDFKRKKGLTARLHPEDIVPCLNKAVALSFQKSDSNRRAIAERGWYPPTKKLLDHPKLRDLIDSATVAPTESSTEALLRTLNTTRGSSAEVMVAIVDHTKRNEGIAQYVAAQRNGSIESVRSEFKKASSGMVFKTAKSSLNNQGLLEAMTDREKKEMLESKKKRTKEKKKLLALKADVGRIRTRKTDDFGKWTNTELKKFLQYKKQKSDPRMPTTLPDLRARAREWQHRPSPNPSPCCSEDEDEGDPMPEDEDDDDECNEENDGESMQI